MAQIAFMLVFVSVFVSLEAKSLVAEGKLKTIESNEIPSRFNNEIRHESIKRTSIFQNVQNFISPLMQTILSNETIRIVFSDPMVQGVLLNPNVQIVLNNPIVQSILTNPELQGVSVLQNIISNLPHASTTPASVVMPIKQTTPTPIDASSAPDLQQTTILRPVLAKPTQKNNLTSVFNMVLAGLDELLKVVQIQMEKRTLLRRA